MGDIVIVTFRPKPGCEDRLDALVREHVPYLRSLGLATSMPETTMRAADGAVVEVFEWQDGAIKTAHAHPEVAALWERFSEVCTYETLASLPEAQTLFSSFRPLG